MMDVECIFTGTDGVDVETQAGMVRQAIRDGYDGIALSIIDPEAFDEVIEEAAAAGIPLVAFNIDDHATPNARLSSVCQRLYDAGKALGMKAAGKKQVTWRVTITGNSPSASAGVIHSELLANPQIHYVLCTGQADTEGAGIALGQHFADQGYQSAVGYGG